MFNIVIHIGIRPMIDVLEGHGGWPVVKGSDWNADNSWGWWKILERISIDLPPDELLLTLSTDINSNDPLQRISVVSMQTAYCSVTLQI